MIDVKDRNGKELKVGDKVRVVQHKNGPLIWQMWSNQELKDYPIGQEARITATYEDEGSIELIKENETYGASFITSECVERIDHE